MKKAFTLIELLIVVAIIAILAAIAVPNFLEAQTRSKISRSKTDMRSIATALEAYRVDNNKLPLVGGKSSGVPGLTSDGVATRAQGSDDRYMTVPVTVTTPIAYLTSIPKDPYHGMNLADDAYDQGSQTYSWDYWYSSKAYFEAWAPSWGYTNGDSPWFVSQAVSSNIDPIKSGYNGLPKGAASWVLMGKGPDKYWAVPTSKGGAGAWDIDYPQLFQYDATNGTASNGNVFRSE